MLTLLCAVAGTMWGENYVKVTSSSDLTSGQYLIVYEAGNVAFNGSLTKLDAVSNTVAVTISNNTIASSATLDKSSFTIDMSAGTIKSYSGYYIGITGYKNGLASSTSTAYPNDISIDGSGNAVISRTFSSSETMKLLYNSSKDQTRFRYFTGASSQKSIQLYKKKVDSPIAVSAPTISVPSGNVSEGTTVIITAEEGLWISYTTDGTDPTTTTAEQWVPNNVANVIINNTCTLKAIAIDPEELDKSEVVEATYTVAGSEQVVFEIVTDASSLKAGDEIVLVSNKDYVLYAMGEQRPNNRAAVELADEFKGGAYPTQLASNNNVAIITLEGSSTAWNFKVDGGYLYAASSSSNYLKTENAVDAAGNANATITISGDKHDAAIIFNGDNKRNNLKFNNSDRLFSCYGDANNQQTVKIYRKTTTTPQPAAPVIWMSYSSANNLDFTGKTDYTAFIATNYRAEEGVVVLTKIEKVPSGEGILIKSNDSSKAIKDIFKESDVPANEPITTQITQMLVGAPNGVEYILPEEGDFTNFVLAKKDGVVGFYKVAQQGALAPNKAYLQIPTASLTSTSGANGITFVEDGTTAIQSVTTATTDDAWYTLQGVRVAQPTRGLYIHNGKKVVVK